MRSTQIMAGRNESHNLFLACCGKVQVSGTGDTREAEQSTHIFDVIYTKDAGKINGKEQYTSQDGTKAITYNDEKGIWSIQPIRDR